LCFCAVFVVEELRGERMENGKMIYLVKWKDDENDTWEPEGHILDKRLISLWEYKKNLFSLQ
jgi:hypothetical protein